MKKVNAGDMSAMTEYATMLEKIGSLAEKLDKAEGNMTTAQASRYLKITTKMADALQ